MFNQPCQLIRIWIYLELSSSFQNQQQIFMRFYICWFKPFNEHKTTRITTYQYFPHHGSFIMWNHPSVKIYIPQFKIKFKKKNRSILLSSSWFFHVKTTHPWKLIRNCPNWIQKNTIQLNSTGTQWDILLDQRFQHNWRDFKRTWVNISFLFKSFFKTFQLNSTGTQLDILLEQIFQKSLG